MYKRIKLHLTIKRANSYQERVIGLLHHKKPITDEGLLIPSCNSIHMFFMRFPIDVVFLDHRNHVVKVVPHINPWEVIPPIKDAYSALELPIGTIESYNICKGDTIIL